MRSPERKRALLRSKLVCLVVAFMVPIFSSASGAPPAEIQHKNKRLHEVNYMKWAVKENRLELGRIPASQVQAVESQRLVIHSVLQNLAAAYSYAGDTAAAIRAMDESLRLFNMVKGVGPVGDEKADEYAIDHSRAVDAVTAIAAAARSKQVVILNEAHHVAFDRVFAMRLARALRKEGFEYLACETFLPGDEHVMQAGYVSRKTGFYSNEPTFAKFLTDANKEGWKFVSYEPKNSADGFRESDMAKNIIKRILAKDPAAKIFVYAGYHHAMERPISHADDDDSRLASQLTRLTGIDPLTVNQTTLFAHYYSPEQERLYERAVKKLKGREPAVLIGEDGKPVKLSLDSFAYDYEVVHPNYVIDPATGREEWLSGLFKPYDVPLKLIPEKSPRAVYAYSSGAPADAVPLDVVVLNPGQRAPKLMLPPGNYEFEYEE